MSRQPLAEYLSVQYPLNVIADPDGGYVIEYPDLPGCMTQVETLEEVPAAANEIRELWIETRYEEGVEIPPASYPEAYSGKFNLRIPRSLHRRLAESAARDGVSLNQYVMTLLDRNDALARVERQVGTLMEKAGTASRGVSRRGKTLAALVIQSKGKVSRAGQTRPG